MRNAQERLNILAQELCLHDHRVTAGNQNTVNLGVLLNITTEMLWFLVRKFQVTIANKLCPTKTVGAVGVTGLPLSREKQHRLIVLMLHARQFFTVKHGSIQLQLPCRMRIETALNLSSSQLNLGFRSSLGHQITHAAEIFISKHPALGNGQLINWIIRQIVSVD